MGPRLIGHQPLAYGEWLMASGLVAIRFYEQSSLRFGFGPLLLGYLAILQVASCKWLLDAFGKLVSGRWPADI